MKLEEASKIARKYSNVILLNRIFPSFIRSILVSSSFGILLLLVIFLGGLEIESRYTFLTLELRALIEPLFGYEKILLLIPIILLLLFIFFYSLHTYSRYFILASLERVFVNNKNRLLVSYEAGEALLIYERDGFVHGLLGVPESNFIMNRLLVSPQDVSNSVSTIIFDGEGIIPEYNKTVTLGSLWKLLYENSEEFKKDLLSRRIQKEIYYDTCDWLDRVLEDEKKGSAWWWRENLSKTRGIVKSLSYGGVDFISKYARELALDGTMKEVGKVLLHKDAIKKLEDALTKTRGANAVIIGGRGTGRETIVKILSKMIDQGDCYFEIEHKRVFEFDNNVLGGLGENEFVAVLTHCFEEALIARNLILVLNDTPTLFDMGQKQGVDIFQLMERYISHSDVSFICICDQSFYQNERHKVLFDKDFEAIHIEDMNSKLLIPFIQDHALIVESFTGKFFTAHSINTVAVALGKYFVEDSPLVKADELMYKIATNNTQGEHMVLDEESVSDTIKSMTGVSTGEIQSDEKEKLLNLENILHKKVMGQNEALKVVASTMRRSRTGLVSTDKPIGSFLFLGPTGVGKTETAKTLAEVFFGNEEHMSRIDMNEYTMSNSSYRLLGDVNDEGDIAKLIHNRPYGVLLLDEFEKSTSDVKDIFLRVLDEGIFTNGAGKIISARTQIIVATSNAGSNFIRESGLNPNSTKEEIEQIKMKLIDIIISDGLFRPELINRFDAVVLFHPLGDDTRTEVAKKMLEVLKQRTLLQGYNVTFTESLVRKVLGGESDLIFGGRAIQRNIQTEVEEALARKIIEGSLHAGDTINLSAEDIQ